MYKTLGEHGNFISRLLSISTEDTKQYSLKEYRDIPCPSEAMV